ncbi:MAG: hypothetical protein M9962_02000 [Oligoflexia bacterium]|nr:hypothetical protein [Oligoflexia bacterium]
MTKTFLDKWFLFLIFFGVIFYLFVFPHGIHGDGTVRYEALLHLIHEKEIKPMIYSYVGPIFSAPLILLGKLVKDQFWWMSRYNTFLFLALLFFSYRLLPGQWTGSAKKIFLILLLGASMFPRHTADYYGEVFSACLAFLSILLINRSYWLIGSVLLSLATWNNPGSIIGAGLIFLFAAIYYRRLRYLFFAVLLPVGIILETYLKFGEFFPNLYLSYLENNKISPYTSGPGFSYPLFFGALSVLFSFGKGLFFYCPGTLGSVSKSIWEDKKDSFLVGASILYLVGLVLMFSRWWSWSGDWFWGPRFYLFASILNALLLTKILQSSKYDFRKNIFLLVALLLSVWVGFQGITFGQDFLEPCSITLGGKDMGFICHYVPEFSPLWRMFAEGATPEIKGRKIGFLIYYLMIGFTMAVISLSPIINAEKRKIKMLIERVHPKKWNF